MSSRDAVIVSTARTGIGKAFRGALNDTHGATLAGHVIAEAVRRAGMAPDEVEDVVLGCALAGRRDGQQHRAAGGDTRRSARRTCRPRRSTASAPRGSTRSRSPRTASAAARPT